jgi:hypothetical protein
MTVSWTHCWLSCYITPYHTSLHYVFHTIIPWSWHHRDGNIQPPRLDSRQRPKGRRKSRRLTRGANVQRLNDPLLRNVLKKYYLNNVQNDHKLNIIYIIYIWYVLICIYIWKILDSRYWYFWINKALWGVKNSKEMPTTRRSVTFKATSNVKCRYHPHMRLLVWSPSMLHLL